MATHIRTYSHKQTTWLLNHSTPQYEPLTIAVCVVKWLTIRLSKDDFWCDVVGCAEHLTVLELPVSIHVVIYHGRSDCEEWRNEEWRRDEMGRNRRKGEEGKEEEMEGEDMGSLYCTQVLKFMSKYECVCTCVRVCE